MEILCRWIPTTGWLGKPETPFKYGFLGYLKKGYIYIYVKVQGSQCSLCGLLVALLLGVFF